jgi:hypothetical protein
MPNAELQLDESRQGAGIFRRRGELKELRIVQA